MNTSRLHYEYTYSSVSKLRAVSCVSYRAESKHHINSAAIFCVSVIPLSSVITRSGLNGNNEFEFNTRGNCKVEVTNNSTFMK